MLLLYATPVSLYCSKTRILLNHKGLEFREEPPVGGYGSDAYKEIVPSGNLPALVDGDLVLADSEAIAEYLEEAYPDIRMLPEELDARAKARECGRFHDTRLEPALRTLFPIVKAGGGTREEIDAATDAITARLGQLDRLLHDPLMRTGLFSLGDCGHPVTFDWIDAICGGLKAPIEWPDKVIEYRAWLDKIPAVKSELEARHAGMKDWVESRLKPLAL